MASAVISLIIAGCTGKGHHAHKHHEGGQIGAPTTGMSSSEYQSLAVTGMGRDISWGV